MLTLCSPSQYPSSFPSQVLLCCHGESSTSESPPGRNAVCWSGSHHPQSLVVLEFIFVFPHRGSCLLAAPSWAECGPAASPGSATGALLIWVTTPWLWQTLPVEAQQSSGSGRKVPGTWRQGRSWNQPSPAPNEVSPSSQTTTCGSGACDFSAGLTNLIGQTMPGTFLKLPLHSLWIAEIREKEKDQGCSLGVKHCPSRGLALDCPPCTKLLTSTYAPTYWRWTFLCSFTQALGKKCRCKITPHLPQNYSFCTGNS